MIFRIYNLLGVSGMQEAYCQPVHKAHQNFYACRWVRGIENTGRRLQRTYPKRVLVILLISSMVFGQAIAAQYHWDISGRYLLP